MKTKDLRMIFWEGVRQVQNKVVTHCGPGELILDGQTQMNGPHSKIDPLVGCPNNHSEDLNNQKNRPKDGSICRWKRKVQPVSLTQETTSLGKRNFVKAALSESIVSIEQVKKSKLDAEGDCESALVEAGHQPRQP
jgi:hypothetical protein